VGKMDLAVNQMMERKEVFADFVNGVVYGGSKVVKAENLERLPERSGVLYGDRNRKTKALLRYGDVRMRADMGDYSVIFADESQLKVHYAMPVRNMLYDALEYVKQVENMEKRHKEAGDHLSGDEFLSGITREDRLVPVVTIVMFLGDEWDGAMSLYEMMGIGERNGEQESFKQFLPDYWINLFCVQDIENTNVFDSCLQQIFGMLKWKKDKKRLLQYLEENREKIKKFDRVEMRAAMMLLGEQKRVEKILMKHGEEDVDVSLAIEEMIQDGKRDGQLRINKLNKRLKAEGRVEDLMRSIDDAKFQRKLLREYGL